MPTSKLARQGQGGVTWYESCDAPGASTPGTMTLRSVFCQERPRRPSKLGAMVGRKAVLPDLQVSLRGSGSRLQTERQLPDGSAEGLRSYRFFHGLSSGLCK